MMIVSKTNKLSGKLEFSSDFSIKFPIVNNINNCVALFGKGYQIFAELHYSMRKLVSLQIE